MRALFVTSDLTPGKIGREIAAYMQAAGHQVKVAAEGVSVEVWKTAGQAITYQGKANKCTRLDEGPLSFALATGGYDVVIVGASSPVHWERLFAYAAGRHRIPVVIMEDIQGGSYRVDFPFPSLVLSPNESAASVSRINFGDTTPIEVVGDINAVAVERDPHVERQVVALRAEHDFVVLYAGQATFDDLQLLVSCMKETGAGCIVPRYHPKLVNSVVAHPDNNIPTTMSAVWDEILDQAVKEGVRVEQIKGEQQNLTNLIACEADITATGFSGTGTVAASAGKSVVSLMTEGMRSQLYKETGLLQSPLVLSGHAVEICEAHNLNQIMSRTLPTPIKAFDPSLAVNAIEKLLSAP